MNWENIAKLGYEVFRKQMRYAGQRVGEWENLTVAERMALVAQAQEICDVFGKAVTA